MWTMINKSAPHKIPEYNSLNDSSYEKINKKNQNINNINVIYDGNPINQIKTVHNNHINNSPLQFDVNVYFGNPKSSFTPIRQNDNLYYSQRREQNQIRPICLLFKSSLEKSGYKLTPEQTVQYKDIYNKYNSINSFYDDFKFYYSPVKEYPMNGNNNIINNIYPTFTKVTNVQILPDKTPKKSSTGNRIKYKDSISTPERINDSVQDNKNENINQNNITKKENINQNKEDNKNMNSINSIIVNNNNNNEQNNYNKKQKVIFECSDSTGSQGTSPVSKVFLKRKRLRKNNQQLGLLSKFYMENKIWSKKQIKEISENIGLKENKIYKWLWDQKNKQYKVTKFVINKKKENEKEQLEQ